MSEPTKEIDCRYTDEIVCPHCGHEFSDSWDYEFSHNSCEVDCGGCERRFFVERNTSVTYSSYEIKMKDTATA